MLLIVSKEAKLIAEELGVKITIIQGEELNERGMGGIYNVGKAAENLPALVVLSHTPASAQKTVAWVGKGIVYDTGGLSIKGKVSTFVLFLCWNTMTRYTQ